MKTYRFLTKPDIRKAAHGWPALSKDLLAQTIADVAVRELSEDGFGRVTVDVQLERADHPESLDELTEVIEQSGYAVLNALVTEWISAEAQRAGIAAATFLLGTGASKNPLVGLVVGAGATLIAEDSGWVADRVLAEYAATHDLSGDWTLRRVQRTAGAGQREPSLSLA